MSLPPDFSIYFTRYFTACGISEAWQKGTNENLNGLLREFYPKGRNLARVSAKTLAQNVAKINNRPKKVLNFQTPADLFEQELQKVLHLT